MPADIATLEDPLAIIALAESVTVTEAEAGLQGFSAIARVKVVVVESDIGMVMLDDNVASAPVPVHVMEDGISDLAMSQKFCALE